MQVLQDHVAVINVVDAVVAGKVLAFGLELEFIRMELFLLSSGGDDER